MKELLGDLPDPRGGNGQRYDLLELLTILLLARLCGGENCVDFELFARSKEPFLREFLTLEGGIPCHGTFSRLFRLLDPAAFSACLTRFAAAGGGGRKTLSHLPARVCVVRWRLRGKPLLSRWSMPPATGWRWAWSAFRPELAKSPHCALLELLVVKAHTVTDGGMHRQVETARAILDRQADYIVTARWAKS